MGARPDMGARPPQWVPVGWVPVGWALAGYPGMGARRLPGAWAPGGYRGIAPLGWLWRGKKAC
jgi:hypothetical protein